MKEENYKPHVTTVNDTIPESARPEMPYKPGFLTKKWQQNLVKFGIWLVLSVIILFTGLGRILSDLAYERGYPYSILIWGGFSILVYLLYSIITFFVDWKVENGLAHEHGIHNMPMVSVLGRWARTTFIDSFGFFFIAMYVLTMFFLPVTFNSDLAPGDHASSSWWILSGAISIVLIPIYFLVRRALTTLLGNSVKRVVRSHKPASMGLVIVMAILNFLALFGMWAVFNTLRLLVYPGWVALGLVLTVGWIIIFVLMMVGMLKSREAQFSIAYLIFTVIVTSWIGLYLYGMLGQTKDTIIITIAYFTAIAVLLPIMFIELVGGFQINDIGDEKSDKIREICKRMSIIPLGVYTYELDGDKTVETKVYGFFMLYYLFVPASLLDKPELYASVAKSIARIKNGEGSVLTIVRVALFTVLSIVLWFVFDITHSSSTFMWFSGITGDPLLIIVMLLVFGAIFGIIGTPIVNMISKMFSKAATKTAKTIIPSEVVDSYNREERIARGVEGGVDAIANLYLNDTDPA